MRIGVDARALAAWPAGIEVYTRNLLRAFSELGARHRFVLYSTKDFPMPAEGPFAKRIGAGRLAKSGTVWMQAAIPHLCFRDRIDLFWSPLQTLPIRLPRSIPAVLTVHDFVHHYFPKSMRFGNWMILKLLAPPSWRRADALITGSSHSEKMIRRFMGSDRDVTVIPHGHLNLPHPPTSQQARKTTSERFAIDGAYILAVGTVEPRKNLVALLRALKRLEGGPAGKHKLVLVGARGWKADPVFQEVERLGLAEKTVFTGAVSDADLVHLYAAADLFVFPSLYEGFGLPVLEAMALGVPVACSRSSSLPEVVGHAGRLFNPEDPGHIAVTIESILGDSAERDRLVSAGMERASKFGWDRAAQETLDVFERTARRVGSWRRHVAPLPRIDAEAGHFDRISRKIGRLKNPAWLTVTAPTSAELSMTARGLDLLGSWKGSAFLDYGCGTGHNAIFAAMTEARLSVGFDVSLDSVRLAKSKATFNGVDSGVGFVVARAERLPFKSGVFDKVLGNGVLHHVVVDRAGPELRRVMKPVGSGAVFTEPLGENRLAQAIRALGCYPGKSRTPGESPLMYRDIHALSQFFPHASRRDYYFLNAAARMVKRYFPKGPLDDLDRKIFTALPALRRLGVQVLIHLAMVEPGTTE